MTDNLKQLLDEAGKNEELKAKLEAITDKDIAVEKAVQLAKEYGIDLTAEDFKPADSEELSDDELDAVAGGKSCIILGIGGGCGCIAAGGGTEGCGCFLFGLSTTVFQV